jgi:tetratricopeptide (TPR) repeat protein
MRYFILFWFFVGIISCNEKKEVIKTASTNSEEETLKINFSQYPDSLPLLQNLVGYYLNVENYDAAFGTINNVQKKDSLNPYVWDLKSMVAMQKGDTQQAIISLENAIEVLPEPMFIISLGSLYAQTKNIQALELADALLFANKAKAEKEAYFIKGLYYTFINEKEKAISFFDKCIALNYTFMNAYLEKGLALYDLNKFEKAADVFEKAVTLQNNFSQGYYYLGKCYEKLNRTQDAVDAYNTAVLRDPDYTEAKEAMAKLGATAP